MSSRPQPRVLARGTAILCGLALCAAPIIGALPASAASPTPSATVAKLAAAPGSAGIGDPDYPDYGNGGYDVDHYGIDVAVTPATGIVSGTTTIQATATQALSSFNLDLVLKASAVTVNGRRAAFTQPTEHELTVTPDRPLAKGKPMTVVVKYEGKPGDTTLNGVTGWVPTKTGAVLMGEPEGAAWWYPANDHPRDKATFDINVTVPKGVQGLSIGQLRGTTRGKTTDTWRWKETRPTASYLAFVAVGSYDVTQGVSKTGIPWVNGVEKSGTEATKRAAADIARVPEIIDTLSKEFGSYPFDAMGAVVFDADFYALETATRPLYPAKFWSDEHDRWKKGTHFLVVVHEQAHQWFGDSVSTHNWRDMWLNEGFASWSEWRWDETHGGRSAAATFEAKYNAIGADEQGFWSLDLANPGPGHEFDEAMYERGGLAVQALRTKLGEQTFDAIVRGWIGHHRYCTATVQEFISYAEQMSHQDLKAFFKAWLSTPAKPAPSADLGFPAEMIPAPAKA